LVQETEREGVYIVAVSGEKEGGEHPSKTTTKASFLTLYLPFTCFIFIQNNLPFAPRHKHNCWTSVALAWLIGWNEARTGFHPPSLKALHSVTLASGQMAICTLRAGIPSFLLHFFMCSNKYLGDSSRGDFSNDITFSIRN
jgi:hypothetical protein